MKKRHLFKYYFLVLFGCIAAFTLPMSTICACETNRSYLYMSFGVQSTDAEMAHAASTQMEGFDIKKGVPEWEAELKKQMVTSPENFDNTPVAHPVNLNSWIGWFSHSGERFSWSPIDCTPTIPWRDDQAVTCKFYQEESFFKKTGWELNFRITQKGIISDVKLRALSNLLGRETLETVQ